MNAIFRRFLQNSSGATAIEYALIASLVGLAPMLALGAAGDAVAALLGQAAAQLAMVGPGDGINVLP